MNNTSNNDFAGLESTDGDSIALQSVHIDGKLDGLLLQMTIRQRYRNQTDTNLETVYTFPLPWGASLMGMDIEINGKRLAATVLGKTEATERYEKAIDEGDTPVMIEQSGMGLFTANLGNLKAGEEAVIEVRYAQLQRFEQDQIRLMVPTTIAPRFGNEHAEGGLAHHETAQASLLAEYPFTLNLQINDVLAHAALHSPSHRITTRLDNTKLAISLEQGGFLDRDFILNLSGLQAKSFAVCAQDGEHYSVMASFCPQLTAYEHKPLALKILVDCSGSMAGDSMHSAKRALHQVLQELGEQDAITYSRFGNEVTHSFLTMQSCTPANLKRVSGLISKTEADMGGTETYDALMSTFKKIDRPATENTARRATNILMITDGSIWNNQQVIEASKNSKHRIFTICVGSAANDNLVRELAEQTGGACEMVGPNENIEQAIMRTFHRLRHAESMELNVDWGTAPLWESAMPFGIFDKDTVHVFARFASQPPQAPILTWGGTKQMGNAQAEELTKTADSVVSRMVASSQIKDSTSAEERLILALQYQLVTDQTNLVLVHQRAEEDKATDLPQLQKIVQMQAAGRAGVNTVAVPHIRIIEEVRYCRISEEPAIQHESPRSAAVWRRESASETMRAMERNGTETYDIPAFLRRVADGDDAPVQITPIELLNKVSESGHIKTWIYGVGQIVDKTTLPDSANQLIDSLEIISGSKDKAWSLFIQWLALHFTYTLPRHAERAVRRASADMTEKQQADGFNLIMMQFSELKEHTWYD